MEKLVRSCEKEYMRMAMLKHEQTFKEQVYELHRLYRIQKILMKTMEARGVNDEAESDDDGILRFIDETEIELTLGPSSYNNKCRNKKIIETSLTSDSGNTLLSSSSTGSSNLMNKIRCQSGIIRESFDDENNIEEQLRSESLRKQPPWFFHQVLNLSMT